jgi:dTDP-4-dehydrorhamnose 3,5-epimerase
MQEYRHFDVACPADSNLTKEVQALPTKLPGVLLIKPRVFQDARGFFLEAWNRDVFSNMIGSCVTFVQDNHSRSVRGVLRGLHYQAEPMAQAKLITVLRGAIFDVAVDIRPSSPTFGNWIGETLDGDSRQSLWIPEGFAHGFLVLSEEADVVYKTTNFYSPVHEHCIRWDDDALAIGWPLEGRSPLVSDKDCRGLSWSQAFPQSRI